MASNNPYRQAQGHLNQHQQSPPVLTPAFAQPLPPTNPPARPVLRPISVPVKQPIPEPVKRRGNVACRRCRRLRTKCVHEKSIPPCEACREAGAGDQCSFPARGEKDLDREFRRRPVIPPISQSNRGAGRGAAGGLGATDFARPIAPAVEALMNHDRQSSPGSPSIEISLGLPTPRVDREDILPPHEEVLEGCRIFVTSYFQLGFIPKAVFLEGLAKNPNSRYGSPASATDHFLDVSKAMVPSEMYKPSLERIQAFFLLAISQWGNGNRDRSSVDMGVAVRMASILKLHCEETYSMEPNTPADQVVQSESARRVFWMIQSQENLHSGYNTPAPFPLEDITTLLPCNEEDFAFGAIPVERAALSGTPPALRNPDFVFSPRRCLFATLIQAHSLWGRVARRACRTDQAVSRLPPWDPQSEFQKARTELHHWEATLPLKHAFSVWNLRGWKTESLHLAYLSVTMVVRLSNIVTRRIYLEDMLAKLSPSDGNQRLEPETPTMANANDRHRPPSGPSPAFTMTQPIITPTYGDSPPKFWETTSDELFENVRQLHEQIDAYFHMRTSDEGFPQILVFCVYMCGSLSYYLMRYPVLCPRLTENGLAEKMAQRSLEVLTELHAAWPTSSKWQRGLQTIASPLNSVSPAATDVETPQQRTLIRTPGTSTSELNTSTPLPMLRPHAQMQQQGPGAGFHTSSPHDQKPEGMLGELFNVLPTANQLSRLGSISKNPLPNELFDMEITAFLQGDFNYGPNENWLNGTNGWGDDRQQAGP